MFLRIGYARRALFVQKQRASGRTEGLCLIPELLIVSAEAGDRHPPHRLPAKPLAPGSNRKPCCKAEVHACGKTLYVGGASKRPAGRARDGTRMANAVRYRRRAGNPRSRRKATFQPGGARSGYGRINICVQYLVPLLSTAMPTPIWVNPAFRIFARWPALFIHP